MISPPRPVVRPPPAQLELDVSLLEGLGMGAMKSTEESMRVTYEDPGQAEEKRRLLRMLGGDEAEVGGIKMGRSGVAARGVIGTSGGVGRMRRTKRPKVAGF